MHSSSTFHTFFCKWDTVMLLAETSISFLCSPYQKIFNFHKTKGSSFNKGVTRGSTTPVISPSHWARWNSNWNTLEVFWHQLPVHLNIFFLNEDKTGYEQVLPKNSKKHPAYLQQGPLANTLEKSHDMVRISPEVLLAFNYIQKKHTGSEVQAFDNVITNFYFRS